MNQPLLSQLDLWAQHERRVLAVLDEALLLLRIETDLKRSEVELNRRLYFCLLDANRRLLRSGGGGFEYPPVSEGKNPPDPDDACRAKREDKIPDFCWSFIDDTEPDSRRCARHFVIECKRLGSPPRSGWVLNENYVRHGILRFVRADHGYAKGESSAAMVGYMESMAPDAILAEVNTTASSVGVASIQGPIAGWHVDGVSRLHQVVRPAAGSSLALRHLWVDLRSSFGSSTGHRHPR